MRTAHAIVCLALVLGGSAAEAQKADGPSQLSREWKRLATPSLTVVGNAREDDLRRAGLEMERPSERAERWRRGYPASQPELTVHEHGCCARHPRRSSRPRPPAPPRRT